MDIKAKDKLSDLWKKSMLARTRFQKVGIVLVCVLWIGLCCPLCFRERLEKPPADLTEADLIGIWKGQYQGIEDRLILREDGAFKQSTAYIWRGTTFEGYQFETDWNPWWLEHRPDGNIRLHLGKARFFPAGVRRAELDGRWPCSNNRASCSEQELPWGYHDLYSEELVYMVEKLVLNVRIDQQGRLVLVHMCTSQDGCDRYTLRKQESSPELPLYPL